MRERFIFEKQYYDAIRELPERKQARALRDFLDYVFYDKEPSSSEGAFVICALQNTLEGNLCSYERYDERRSGKYKTWKTAVLKRDGRRCQRCGAKKDLCVHHIKPFSEFPELRFDVDNGITLCRECHRMEHKNER